MTFKERPVVEKPREKALKYGLHNLNNAELLAIFLDTGTKTYPVTVLAERLLNHFGGLVNLLYSDYKFLVEFNGLGPSKALKLLATLEIVHRVEKLKLFKKETVINHPTDLLPLFKTFFDHENEFERFYLISLDNNNCLLKYELLFQGSNKSLIIDLGKLFQSTFFHRAKKIICVHNHPSNNFLPSDVDIKTTKEIAQISKKLNIVFVDHIIYTAEHVIYSMYLKKKFAINHP